MDLVYCSNGTTPNPQPFGVTTDVYEYKEFEAGATPYTPPFRFPGQYFDPETDLHENWNRYYDPSTGRYLSPEPLLQSPTYVRRMAEIGMSVPAYAYGANNPVRYTDPDGLRFTSTDPTALYVIRQLRRDPVIGSMVRAMDDDPNFVVDIQTNVAGLARNLGQFVPRMSGGRCTGGTVQLAAFAEINRLRNAGVGQSWPPPLGHTWFTLTAHELGHVYADYTGRAGGWPLYFENSQRPFGYWRSDQWHAD